MKQRNSISRRTEGRIRHITWVIILTMLMTMMPLSWMGGVHAASSYGEQPYAGTTNNGDNGLTMLDPNSLDPASNITVLKEAAADDTGYDAETQIYLNQINGTQDISKKDMLTFTFRMSAGMNNFDEIGFLNASPTTGLPANIDNIAVYSKDMKTLVAKYDAGHGDLVYVKAIKSGGNDLNPHGNVRTKALVIGIKKSALRNGQYILQFGKDLHGNNTAKKLNCNIRFLFTVKISPVLKEMITETESFLSGAVIGTESGSYPAAAKETLEQAVQTAKKEKSRIEQDASLSDGEKEEQSNAAAGVLYDALEVFKSARNLNLSIDQIRGMDRTVNVGASGTAAAEISCENITGEELVPYQDVTWASSSDCLSIDPVTGKWYAVYAGTATVTATSKAKPDQTKSVTVNVSNPSDVEVAVCKASNATNVQILVEQAVKQSSVTPASVRKLRLFTLPGYSLDEDDIAYLKQSMTSLQYLDLKRATVKGNALPNLAFSGCTQLQEVLLPETLAEITMGDFEDCTSLKKVDITAGITSVQGGAFAGCQSLDSKLYLYSALPPAYTTQSPVYGDAFNGLKSAAFQTPVKTIVVPAGCAEDYRKAAGWKKFNIEEMEPVKLTVHFTKTQGLEAAAEAACSEAGVEQGNVTHLAITSPDGVELDKTYDIAYLQTHFLGAQVIDLSGTHFDGENIQSSVFADRKNVKQYIFSDAITHFGKKAFANNQNLRTFTVPESVAKREGGNNRAGIGEACFSDCPKLTALIMNCEPPGYDGSFPATVKTIYVPAALVETYQADDVYGGLSAAIEPQVSLSVDETASVTVLDSVKLQSRVTWNPDPDHAAAAGKAVSWEILSSDQSGDSDASVASVDSTGTVTGNKYGSVVVRATYDKGGMNECYDTCLVKVVRPEAVTVTAEPKAAGSNAVSWTAMSGADGYQVMRAGPDSGTYQVIATVAASDHSYVDQTAEPGKTYYYKVRGYRQTNGEPVYGEDSEPQKVTTQKEESSDRNKTTPTETAANAAKIDSNFLSPIAGSSISTTANISKKTLTVRYKAVKNAVNYRIYYRKAAAAKWTTAWSGKGKTAYTIKKLQKNGLYQFKIAAYGKVGTTWVKGKDSAVQYRYLTAVSKVKLSTGKKKMRIRWKGVKGATGYQVQVTTDKAFKKNIKTKTVKGAKHTALTFRKCKRKKTYYVKVRPYCKKGGKTYPGVWSGVKKGKIK